MVVLHRRPQQRAGARRRRALARARRPRRTTAGHAVAPRARGRGVAGQALRALTAFAWSLPDVARVELFVEPWVASLRTAEAAGYGRETVLRGAEVRGRSTDLVRLALSRPSDHP